MTLVGIKGEVCAVKRVKSPPVKYFTDHSKAVNSSRSYLHGYIDRLAGRRFLGNTNGTLFHVHCSDVLLNI